MKKAILLSTAVLLAGLTRANNVQLLVQRVDNGGLVPGNTFRVYAQMPDANHTLHIVYGDQQNPLSINTTAPFYQNQYAGYSAGHVSDAGIQMDAAMRFDSWVTLGYADNNNNDMWDIGVDFVAFDENGGNITSTNGGWFLIPSDEKTQQDGNGLVLIAQFTTAGIASGVLNLQGWTGPNAPWTAKGLTFTTTNAETFGCTDSKASNYSTEATFNDGTCEYNNTPVAHNGENTISGKVDESTWSVFPNPLRDNIINIQLNNIDVKTGGARIDIVDMTGKLVGSHNISADALLPGNRVALKQDMSAGTYKVVLVQGKTQETKTIVVEK